MVDNKAQRVGKAVPTAAGAAAGIRVVRSAVADAPAQARGLVDELNERLAPALSTAREHLAPVLVDARERIGGTVDERVVPALHDAGERLAPVLATARVRATETARDVGGRLVDRAEPYAHEAARRGGNALEALKGSEVAPVKKRRRFRSLLVVAGLGGLAYAAWKALAGPKDDPWTDSPGTGGLGDTIGRVQQAAAGVADTVKSRVAGGADPADDGSPSAEEGAFVSDLGTFATDGPDAEPVVVEVVDPVNPVPLDGVIDPDADPVVTEPTEDH